MDWVDRIGRRIRLRDLHVLLAVAESGSMSKASAQLAVSHPVVSKTILQLEQSLGVQLFERSTKRLTRRRTERPDSQLVSVANGRSLIVVNRDVLKQLPGINVIPLHDNRAFLAFDHGASMADLELAVVDRLQSRSISLRERKALSELRGHVRRWRRDPNLRCDTRSIIVVERVG